MTKTVFTTGASSVIGDDFADAEFYAAAVPPHVQISEIEVLATHQASARRILRTEASYEAPLCAAVEVKESQLLCSSPEGNFQDYLIDDYVW